MLKVSINPSRQLALLLCIAHAAAAGASLVADAAIGVKVTAVLLIAVSCGISLYGPALLRSGKAIVALELAADGSLTFRTRRGEWHEGRLLDSSFVTPYLTVLNVAAAGSALTRHVVILADSVAPDDFRRLRVWLRWRMAAALKKI